MHVARDVVGGGQPATQPTAVNEIVQMVYSAVRAVRYGVVASNAAYPSRLGLQGRAAGAARGMRYGTYCRRGVACTASRAWQCMGKVPPGQAA